MHNLYKLRDKHYIVVIMTITAMIMTMAIIANTIRMGAFQCGVVVACE